MALKVSPAIASDPYVDSTVKLMQQFGALVQRPAHGIFAIADAGYTNPAVWKKLEEVQRNAWLFVTSSSDQFFSPPVF